MRARILFAVEILILSTLVFLTRCANFPEVFVGRQIYFVDADCYARMSRARLCFEHPGTIVRWHDFENFPLGISPHTTAPLDYLIVVLAKIVAPFSRAPLELAGAMISPLLSVALGIFLCWWSRQIHLRFRWALLILFAVSPILAHGFALGRPDHQSLLIALVSVAICAEWSITLRPSRNWGIVSGAAWGLAVWVSIYEPLVLLAAVAFLRWRHLFNAERRAGWIVFAGIIAMAIIVERRLPGFLAHKHLAELQNWSATIGELSHVSLRNGIWFQWCGWLLLATPILFIRYARNNRVPMFALVLLAGTFFFAIWQARWSYFFVALFALVLPEILAVLNRTWLAVPLFIISLYPIAQAWDQTFSSEEITRRSERRIELMELRRVAQSIDGPLLAPWWLSSMLAYWSGHSAVAGSSHESIAGIDDSAVFYAANDIGKAHEICTRRRIEWVVASDADQQAKNCRELLTIPIPKDAFCYLLARSPSRAPAFLRLRAQTGRFKLYQVEN